MSARTQTPGGIQVSARTIWQPVAAFVAIVALALNALVQAQAAPFDAFDQPICSEHASAAPAEQPGAPADDVSCQFCCTLTFATSIAAPVLPIPTAMQWKQAATILPAPQLPSPPRHLLAPPRGPPQA